MNHTPQQSKAFLIMLNTLTNLQFVDSSYSNDACDSVLSEKYGVQVFFPNVINPFNLPASEAFVNFGVAIWVDGETTPVDNEFTLLELVYFLNAFEWDLAIDSNSVGKYFGTGKEFIIANAEDWECIDHLLRMDVGDEEVFGGGAGAEMEVKRIK